MSTEKLNGKTQAQNPVGSSDLVRCHHPFDDGIMVNNLKGGLVQLRIWKDQKVTGEYVMEPCSALHLVTSILKSIPSDWHKNTHALVRDAVSESFRRAGNKSGG